jgi:hypothetical protein
MRSLFKTLTIMMFLSTGCAAELGEDPSLEDEELEQEGVADELEGTSAALTSLPSVVLVSARSGKAVTGGTLSTGSLVTQQSLIAGVVFDNQRWVFDGQTARLSPVTRRDLCMAPENTLDGARIFLVKCDGSIGQAWKLRLKAFNGKTLARYENLLTHKLLDNGGTNAEGGAITAFTENGTTNQLFERRF